MSSGPSPRPNLRTLVSLALLFLAAAWFYTWAPATFPVHWTSRSAEGYYAELTHAYRLGQLHLLREPAPELVALPNPYDPEANVSLRVNDLSYYKGHYYLYHGVTPVLTLMFPFRAVTGRYLTDPAAALVFCLGGAFFSLLLITEIRSRAAPRSSFVVLIMCALAVLFADGYYLVLRNSGVNHVAIASAYFFLQLAIWGAFRSLVTRSRNWPWLLLAATAYGLAIASRPNYVFGASALLIPLLMQRRRAHPASPGGFVRNLVAVALPLMLIVGGMLVHNFLRFDWPLEFGQRYMLGAWDQRNLGFFGLKYLPVNAWNYLCEPGQLRSNFPFLTAPSWQAIGVLVQTPFIWLGLSAGLLGLKCFGPPGTSVLRTMAAMLALILACNLGLLLLLPSGNDAAVLTSANARYTFDFLPVLVLLTCVSVLGLDHQLADYHWPRRIWRVGIVGLTGLSLLAALSLDFQRFPEESYRPLTRVLNWPTYLAQHWLGSAYGPVTFEIVFPPDKLHHYEPLISTGRPPNVDLLYMFYSSPDTIQFGLVGTAMKGPMSPPIPVTYGQPHRLTVSMGSLYPSGDHPLLATLSDADISRLERTLRIDLDGQTVFEAPSHFSASTPQWVQFGTTGALRDYAESAFTGQILSSRRLPINQLDMVDTTRAEYGALRLTLRFPEGKAGTSEPLVVSGVQSAGDLVYVRYESDRHIRLGFDHWGHKGLQTVLLPIDYSIYHTVEIQSGSLLPPAGHILFSKLSAAQVEHLKNRVRIVLDGEVVLDSAQSTYDSSPYDVVIGRNTIGGSSCEYQFTGEIKSSDRLPLPADLSR